MKSFDESAVSARPPAALEALLDCVELDLNPAPAPRYWAAAAHSRLQEAAIEASQGFSSASARARRHLIQAVATELDAQVGRAVERAHSALTFLKTCDVTYITLAPTTQPEYAGEYIEASFDRLLLRSPAEPIVEGLAAAIQLRGIPIAKQWQLARYLHWRSQAHELPMLAWHNPKMIGENLAMANRLAARSSKGVSQYLLLAEQCFDDLSQGEGMAIPFVLGLEPTREAVETWASAASQLARELSRSFDEIRGTEVKAAKRRWNDIDKCADLLRLLAAWGRSALCLFEHPLCDLCYRHSTYKIRCATHISKSSVSRESRLAQVVLPVYKRQKRDLELQLRPSLRLASLQRGGNTRSTRAHAEATLKSQINGLERLLGPELYKSALDLITMICRYVEQHHVPQSQSRRLFNERLLSLVSLRAFWMLWCLRGPTEEFSEFKQLTGRGYDQYNPLARAGSASLVHISDELIRQRAWQAGLKRYFADYVSPMYKALSMRQEQAKSLRGIGKVLGVSAPAAARWIKAASAVDAAALCTARGLTLSWEEYDESQIVHLTGRTRFTRA